jgi:cytidyltransferase-like protein
MPRIYCNGVFNLCHIGHIKKFEQASKYGQIIVGVHSDADVVTYKRYPIQTTIERVETVKLMKWVDEVIPMKLCVYTLIYTF